MKARIFNIMQYENHPISGEPLWNENAIIAGLNHKTIKRWAYIAHDEDVYSDRDESDSGGTYEAGKKKPKHWHVVIELGSNRIELGIIAKWFSVPDNFVEIAKGAGAFLDCVQYLTHERAEQQELGKRLYSDDKVKANFDFRAELNKRAERKAIYGRDVEKPLDRWVFDLNHGTKTLRDCFDEDSILYGHNVDLLRKQRRIALEQQKPPSIRVNFYISGKRKDGTSGGIGKSLASRAIARSLVRSWPGCEDWDDDRIYFIVGAKNVSFEGYDGQPVIIWDDCKAYTMLEKLGSRENVYNVLDTHPSPVVQRQNVKNSYVPLVQSFNIISSSEDYIEFLDGLAGEYKKKDGELVKADDKTQAYRRVPAIICLHEEDFDVLFNKGFFYNTSEFTEYEEYKGLNLSYAALRPRLKEAQAQAIEAKANKFIADKVNAKIEEEAATPELSEEEFQWELEFAGLTKPQMEARARAILTENLAKLGQALEKLKTEGHREDLTKEELIGVIKDFRAVIAKAQEQIDKKGIRKEWDASFHAMAVAEYERRHADDDAIPLNYDEEVKAIENALQASYRPESYDELIKQAEGLTDDEQ